MKIGIYSPGAAVRTLGLDIVCAELGKNGFADIVEADAQSAKELDVLLVSLYWVDQVIPFIDFLIKAKINPARRKPVVIVGGSVTFNPWPINGLYNYAVVGDGEVSIVALVKAIEKGDSYEAPNIIEGEYSGGCIQAAHVADLKCDHYVELRTNKITRIEIGRGCKRRCAFCQIAHIKPYRELPVQIVKNLIYTAPTKNIALFAPDRGSHSSYAEIEDLVKKYGKRNMGTDIRLDSTRDITMASAIRFGLEGWSEKQRRMIKKPYSNSDYVRDMLHIFLGIKTPKGLPITCATQYMMLGLPGCDGPDYAEFFDTLGALDAELKKAGIKKVTIFLPLNDFTPFNHTPLELASLDLFENHQRKMEKYKKRLAVITQAYHGGSKKPAVRLIQALAARGGPRSNLLFWNLATNTELRRATKLPGNDAAIRIISAGKKLGVDMDLVVSGKCEGATPWGNIKV